MKRGKKKLILLFLIILVLSIGLVVAIKIDDENFNSDNKEYSDKYLFKVTYLIVDSNKTDKDVTMEELNNDSSNMLNFLNEFIPLEKDGNYLYADLLNFTNPLSLSRISDYSFTKNNLNGEVIDDCEFDSKTKKIKIPVSYYEDRSETVPIQAEFVTRLSKREIQNTKFDVNVKNLFTKKISVTQSGYDQNTSFSISNSKKINVLKKDLEIYVNNKNKKVEQDKFEFDSKTGMITVYIPTMFINNIDVKINGSLLEKIGLFNSVKATSSAEWKELGYDMKGIRLNSKPNLNVGEELEYSTYPYYNKVKNNNNFIWGYTYYYNADSKPDGYVINGTEYAFGGVYLPDFNDSSHNLYFPEMYIITLCSAHRQEGANYGEPYNVPFKFNVLTEPFSDTINGQSVTSQIIGISSAWYNTQSMRAAFKIYWEDSKGQITVTKKLKDGNFETTANASDKFDINLYSNDSCFGTPTKTVKTNDAGKAVFSDLKLGTYSVNETLTAEQQKNWQSVSGCQVVTVDNSDTKSGDYYIESTNYVNRKRRYCYRIRKVDRDNPTATVPGVSFTLSNGVTQVTGNDGIATFSNLSYQDYTVYESATNTKFWNDNTAPRWVDRTTLTEMSYDGAGGYSCLATAANITLSDSPVYYCIKVKKEDDITKEPLEGAVFETSTGLTATTGSDGIATFFLGRTGGIYNVSEREAPFGYTKSLETKPISATKMDQGTTVEESTSSISKCGADPDNFKYYDSKNLINWYKVTEDGSTRANGAKFKVKNSSGVYITVDSPQNQTDKNGVTKSCYRYKGTGTTDEGTATVMQSMNVGSTNGEVCISGLPKGNYTVEEIVPAQYHTFGSKKTIQVTTKITFDNMSNSNKFINNPTYFEFTKTALQTELQTNDTVGTDYYNKTTNELKKIEFNVTDTGGNILSFVETTDSNGNKLYSYNGNDIDRPASTVTSSLHLDDLRKIRIEHLPWGTYNIKEKNTNTCDASSDYSNCIGYYYPEYNLPSDYQFVIGHCTSDKSTSCSSYSKATQSLVNEPTSITFTKKDFYNYEDPSDVVDFENDRERNDFDRIDFKIKDSDGNYLTLQEVGTSGSCLQKGSYREYRYVVDAPQTEGGTVLHTCGGDIKITNLCRGKQYIVEEVSVPEDSVFVKENTESTRTEVSYTIPCKKGEVTPESNTKLINDKGTRVRFEKRDSKYNYLIPDETTTFEVYRCKKGTECHPTDNKDENGKILESEDYKLVKFTPRAVLNLDEEDTTDAEGLSGVEIYKAISDSDVKSGQKYVTELHPYKGILVLRYLQSGYNYVLVETVAPKNYKLPVGRNAETKFIVRNDTVSVEEVDVPNKPTSILIKKYSSDGNLLTGAQFKIYEGTTCDSNLSAMGQPKVELKLKTIRDGVYENRPEQDTSVITTCANKNGMCNNIKTNEVTKLTYTDYLGTWAEYGNNIAKDKETVELQEGEALIQYLEYGHCYIIEEIKAPEGYSLPKEEEDRFTMVTIKENDSYEHDTGKTLVNTPTPFTFYKFDEYNNLLDGAQFKLQKLDDNKKYHDLSVTEEIKDGKMFYKVDSSSDNYMIRTNEGSATIYYLSAGQYRVIETKAAPGKELTKNPNIVTFYVDEQGNVFGSSIIINKEKTEKIKVISRSRAELIVNIRTGQLVIKYGLIIAVLLAVITGLMILKKKEE